jgi:microsomal dipeptidase-like Zn-dependent dipeptidase
MAIAIFATKRSMWILIIRFGVAPFTMYAPIHRKMAHLGDTPNGKSIVVAIIAVRSVRQGKTPPSTVLVCDIIAPRLSNEHVAPHGDVVTALAAMSKKCGGNEACSTIESERIDHEAMAAGQLPWEKIVEHIDHAVKVAGTDHVGLGSDFDGATMPLGMEDASKLPRITEALLTKGIAKPMSRRSFGGNILRVMEAVERAARR